MRVGLLAVLGVWCGGCEASAHARSRPVVPPEAHRSVPVVAPDSVPAGLYSASSLVEDPDLPGSRYVRDVVVVLFRSSATHSERLAAVAAVSGVVIGGYRTFGGEGYYLVRVHGDTSVRSAKTAVTTLRALGQVEEASLESVLPRTPIAGPRASGVVPPLPPHSTPRAHFSNRGNWITNPPYISGTIIRDVLEVHFRMGSSQSVRQSAIESVSGRVLGGIRMYPDGDGLYYIRVPATEASLLSAKSLLEAHPAVELVAFVSIGGMRDASPRRSRGTPGSALGTSDSVPAIAPDSIPGTLLASLPTLTTPNGQTLKAQLVVVLFRREASVADRTRVIAKVGGVVVGGRRTIQGDGWYIVRVPNANTVDGVLDALVALRSDPSVEVAGDYSTSTPSDESWLKQHDGQH